ncbi:uncharacterized protein EURHEDRAFT_416073 [Aspergillus ruber CBS 135680]|uniref:DUF6594 domain-containing protein n=1 Tax=Aspergillus ruber (strain CBS 135680) TaxID=1388766 RepID=A0A017S4M1_ASPRC|nr:uncharacterized protein EURHEDRAFT_416073 [Aspergillus ruber CBS 135680]EYE91801.1 hypothetical protein EURHEDRAFT_416073 [Aspergillus ruber CBS 135680]
MQPLTKSPRGRRSPPGDDIEKQMIQAQAVPVPQRPPEDQPAGYPRLSAHIAADDTHQIYRRFSTLRTRILLSKQDSLSVLENKLDKIDRAEKCKVFLENRRRDRNQERQNVLLQIEGELAGYDELVERSARVASYTQARKRDVERLKKWVDENGCIAKEESRYLGQGKDLFTFSSEDEDPLSRLERSVEDALIPFFKTYYKKQTTQDTPPNGNVSIPSIFLAKRVARASMAAIVTTALLLPMLVCNFLPSPTARVAITAISVMVLISMMSGFTKARSIEVLAASAIYATVMMVLITNGS